MRRATPVPVSLPASCETASKLVRRISAVLNWQAQFDANKNAFALSFVQRAELSLAIVAHQRRSVRQLLNTNAGGVLTDTELLAVSQLSVSPSDPTCARTSCQIADNRTVPTA